MPCHVSAPLGVPCAGRARPCHYLQSLLPRDAAHAGRPSRQSPTPRRRPHNFGGSPDSATHGRSRSATSAARGPARGPGHGAVRPAPPPARPAHPHAPGRAPAAPPPRRSHTASLAARHLPTPPRPAPPAHLLVGRDPGASGPLARSGSRRRAAGVRGGPGGSLGRAGGRRGGGRGVWRAAGGGVAGGGGAQLSGRRSCQTSRRAEAPRGAGRCRAGGAGAYLVYGADGPTTPGRMYGGGGRRPPGLLGARAATVAPHPGFLLLRAGSASAITCAVLLPPFLQHPSSLSILYTRSMFSTNVTIFHHLISQAGWNRCNLSIYLSIYLHFCGKCFVSGSHHLISQGGWNGYHLILILMVFSMHFLVLWRLFLLGSARGCPGQGAPQKIKADLSFAAGIAHVAISFAKLCLATFHSQSPRHGQKTKQDDSARKENQQKGTREIDRSITPIQPHKADSGAARTSPGRSQKT